MLAGYFWDSDGTAQGFVFERDGNVFTAFTHPGAASDGKGTYIFGINDSGRIAGWYHDGEKAQGFSQGFSQ